MHVCTSSVYLVPVVLPAFEVAGSFENLGKNRIFCRKNGGGDGEKEREQGGGKRFCAQRLVGALLPPRPPVGGR